MPLGKWQKEKELGRAVVRGEENLWQISKYDPVTPVFTNFSLQGILLVILLWEISRPVWLALSTLTTHFLASSLPGSDTPSTSESHHWMGKPHISCRIPLLNSPLSRHNLTSFHLFSLLALDATLCSPCNLQSSAPLYLSTSLPLPISPRSLYLHFFWRVGVVPLCYSDYISPAYI